MPPWKAEPGSGEFLGQPGLTDGEIDLIQRWITEGAVEGDLLDLPPTTHWTDGWQIGKPDLIVRPIEAKIVPAEGTDAFRVFVIPIPINAARYVRGVEFRPDESGLVHHANILLDRTSRSRVLNDHNPRLGEEGILAGSAAYPSGHFLGWTPGQPDFLLPETLSWRLDPGTDLVVQLHIQPSGKPEVVQFSVGFYFASRPPSRTPAVVRLGRQDIDIAAGDSRYVISDSYTLPVDVEVLALKPHAHFRAREVRSMARLPDGSMRPLLHIKDWDFKWQHVYRYATPVVLPKGTTLEMQYTYDNSSDNPRNPQHPPRRVRWGPRSHDEMGDFWIQLIPLDDRNLAMLRREIDRKFAADNAIGYEALIAQDPQNIVLHDDLAYLYLELGQPNEAVAHYETTLRLKPDSAAAYFNAGAALMLAGKTPEAIDRYREALRIDPNYAAAHNNLGSLLDRQGNLDEALAHYREAMRLRPDHSGAHNNIGFVLARRGQIEAAISYFREALRIDPRSADAHYNIGLALRRQGNVPEAISHLRYALQANSDWAPVLTDLAWMLVTTSDAFGGVNEAMILAERAVSLTARREPKALDTLAAAYAATAQFDRAVQIVREAIALDPAAAAAAGMLEREALYRSHQPYRELPVPGPPPQR